MFSLRATLSMLGLLGSLAFSAPFSGRLLVTGMQLNGLDTADQAAGRTLILQSLAELHRGPLVDLSDSLCQSLNCAQRILGDSTSDRALWISSVKLGSTFTLSASWVGAKDQTTQSQRTTFKSPEDLPAAADQIVRALLNNTTLAQAATVDNVTEKESKTEPLRRRSVGMTGINFGFLYPFGNDAYTRTETDCIYPDNNSSYNCVETVSPVHQAQYMNLGASYWYEFRQNLALDVEAKLSMPVSIAGQINVIQFFGRGDISPFVGGGAGVEYVFPDHDDPQNKRNAGPQLNAQGGIMLFRTYDVRAMARAGYQVTFNSDYDNGAFTEVGFLYAPRERVASTSSGSNWWKWVLAYLLVAGVIGAATE